MQAAPPRVQKLGVIKVTRSTHEKHGSNIMYRASSISGWVLLVAVLIFACLMQFWLLVSFLLVVCTTGFLISVTFGSRLRQVNVPYSTNQNRLVVAARHMNETEWQAFYGESRVVNSLLNWPLLVQGQPRSQHMNVVLYWCLRILILSQWMLAIGAAASKGWEAFGIIGWIVLCLFCHNFIFTPSRCAGWWLRHTSGVQVERYNLSLSSRRALLNTLMALNPDTLSKSSISVTGLAELHHEALLWIDPILKKCQSRTEWEETSKKALFRTAHEDARTLADPSKNSTAEGEKKADEMAWEQRQPWYPFIAEGIEMAARVKVHARLDQIFAEAANAG
ncbi:Hypothetical protein D9617_5g069860 [Elsinoe fawcettii]|nr:Hypothetical protein D9617_5g069860 [Elsinoe fawcettii]